MLTGAGTLLLQKGSREGFGFTGSFFFSDLDPSIHYSAEKHMIRKCIDSDFEAIYEVINDAAQAYKGVIPGDRWHEPYMDRIQLRQEIEDEVCFWGIEKEGALVGVMGIQDKGGVCLIRHAYVKTNYRNIGLGTRLLKHLESMIEKPILIGTWADAMWAIRFYQKSGYRLLSEAEKNDLLTKYWNIPDRQVQTSVVLADRKWSTDPLASSGHQQSISVSDPGHSKMMGS